MIEFYNDWTKRLPKVKSMAAVIIATIFTMVLRQSMHCFNDNFGRYQSKIDRISSNVLTNNMFPEDLKTTADNNSDCSDCESTTSDSSSSVDQDDSSVESSSSTESVSSQPNRTTSRNMKRSMKPNTGKNKTHATQCFIYLFGWV